MQFENSLSNSSNNNNSNNNNDSLNSSLSFLPQPLNSFKLDSPPKSPPLKSTQKSFYQKLNRAETLLLEFWKNLFPSILSVEFRTISSVIISLKDALDLLKFSSNKVTSFIENHPTWQKLTKTDWENPIPNKLNYLLNYLKVNEGKSRAIVTNKYLMDFLEEELGKKKIQTSRKKISNIQEVLLHPFTEEFDWNIFEIIFDFESIIDGIFIATQF